MSIKFPTTPHDLINAIEQDAPAVYDILMEEYHPTVDDRYPTREELTTILENYSGNNYDVHYWFGRWSMMKDLIKQNDPDDTIWRDNTGMFLNDMTSIHYGYHLIRCETCDTVHLLYSRDNQDCHCGTSLDNDHPDLFF